MPRRLVCLPFASDGGAARAERLGRFPRPWPDLRGGRTLNLNARERAIVRDRVARARLDEDPAREVPPADTRDRGAPAQVMELERAEDRLLAAVERKRQELAKKLKT